MKNEWQWKQALLGVTVIGLLFIGRPVSPSLTLNTHNSSGYPPNDCYHEDTWDHRVWLGTMAPGEVFEVIMPFCDGAHGGLGIEYTPGPGADPGAAVPGVVAGGRGNFHIQFISPLGPIQEATLKDVQGQWETWWACIPKTPEWEYPNYAGTIAGGNWLFRIENIGNKIARDVQITLEVGQYSSMNQSFQLNFCPPEDRNF